MRGQITTVAYGFCNTNRSNVIPEETIAYKQLQNFYADEIVIDIHWETSRRVQLERLIEEMTEGDVLYMYSVDTLLRGKDRFAGVEYYRQIIEKGIRILVLDMSGDLPKISPISTFYPGNHKNHDKKFTDNERKELVALMYKMAENYSPAQSNRIPYKANFTDEFREIYFMYEAYRIGEKQLLELMAKHLGMTAKQTFMGLCREYEKSLGYVFDFEQYCDTDEQIINLPKRTGGLPADYDDIMVTAQTQTGKREAERIGRALEELNILSNPNIIRRYKLLSDKAPKPRKYDREKIDPVFTDKPL